MERERPNTDYPVLRFYRNWVVHEKLDRPNANPPMRDILDNFETVLQAAQAGANVEEAARRLADSISLARLEGDINQVCDDFPQFDRAMVGRPEDWRDFRPRLLSILADITLQADGSYQYLKELKIDSTHQEFDTLVLTPRSGQPVGVPLMQ